MNDAQAVLKIANGDSEEMGRIMDRYSRLLWKISDSILGGIGAVQDIEECVADAFVYLWENRGRIDLGRGTLKTYLSVVVRSKSIDRFRALTRRAFDDIESLELEADTDVEADAVNREQKIMLREAVSGLDEPMREIVIRRFYYGQTPAEIAEATGLAKKQVENALYRSKEKLRGALDAAEKKGTK